MARKRSTTPKTEVSATEEVAESTTLDADVTTPSTTAPGDGAADTTDPTEVAVSVTPEPGAEAIAVGTVNAVLPVEAAPVVEVKKGKDRIEKYTAVRPDGTQVTVTHNIDTGVTSVK